MTSPAPNLDSLFDVLSSYIARGWPVLPLWGVREDGTCACPDGPKFASPELRKKHPHGKHPHKLAPNGVKNATLDTAMLRSWIRANPRGNWGIRCGLPMADGRFLVVVDRDPRNGGDATLEQIQGSEGELPESATAETGGAGGHYLFGSQSAVAAFSPGPGIDVLGTGKYFVVAPSRHESGGSYVWSLGLGPDDVRVADAPAWLLKADEVGPRPAREGDGTARDTVLGEAFFLAGKLGAVYPDGVAAVCCPWADEHSDARGRGEDSSTVILPPAGGSRLGGWSCKHSHCVSRTWKDVLQALPSAAVQAAQQKYPMLQAVRYEEKIPGKTPSEVRDILRDVQIMVKYNPKGNKIISDIVNLVTILTYDPRWTGILVYDEFAQVLRFTKPPPWHADDAPKVQGDVWSDSDTTCMDLWLRRHWAFEASRPEKIREGVYTVGRRVAINPLREWLDGLKWDGVKRLATWTHRYLGSVNNAYTQAVGTKWMISAVARAFVPGCKADHVIILEGNPRNQGKGKSTALRNLVGSTWFSDTPLDIGNKDAYMSLRGRWCVELAELASLGKTDADRLKAFFSSPTDYFRPPYGREMVDVPRSCVFAGTVNLGQYLKDETGNRRYWPVICGAIDQSGIIEDRDQLWAEAVQQYKAGVIWWPAYEEREMFELEADGREEVDGWTEAVAGWSQSEQAKSLLKKGYLTAADVLVNAIGLEVGKLDRGTQARIGIIMTRGLNWHKERVSHAGARVYAFMPRANA